MHDGIALEALGTPAVTICTTGFQLAGEAQARALGMPHYPLVLIAHPLTTMTPEEVARQAQRAWEQIECLLLGRPLRPTSSGAIPDQERHRTH